MSTFSLRNGFANNRSSDRSSDNGTRYGLCSRLGRGLVIRAFFRRLCCFLLRSRVFVLFFLVLLILRQEWKKELLQQISKVPIIIFKH